VSLVVFLIKKIYMFKFDLRRMTKVVLHLRLKIVFPRENF